MITGPIFEPLHFKNLTVKNRIFRSSISGRFDDWDGRGQETRIAWELKFARGGVGAIISAFSPIDVHGRIVPSYAAIDQDSTIPFWRELGNRVHQHDCRYIIQLAHGGRQRDIPGIEFARGLSSTDHPDPLHGFPARRMMPSEINQVIGAFARAAYRAREAGLDGVEIHAANGYLITQFLSSAINDRKDDYGGALENRARLVLETVRAIRTEVGPDFHLQVKLSTTERNNAFYPWLAPGNTIEDSALVAHWLEEAGVDAIHVSTGSSFPHPDNPAGDLPLKEATAQYGVMLPSGKHTFRNYLGFRLWPINRLFRWRWSRPPDRIEGANLADARALKASLNIPIICTGGFQTASVIARALTARDCDAVSIARPLVANNDLVHIFASGFDRAPRPCTYCNKCLFNVLINPLGCYDETRFSSREDMIADILSVFSPLPPTSASP